MPGVDFQTEFTAADMNRYLYTESTGLTVRSTTVTGGNPPSITDHNGFTSVTRVSAGRYQLYFADAANTIREVLLTILDASNWYRARVLSIDPAGEYIEIQLAEWASAAATDAPTVMVAVVVE